MTLGQLLERLSHPENQHEYEQAWAEFLRRYRTYMEKKIIHRCYEWNIPRLPLQIREVADDIFGDVLEYLCKDQARKLQDFKNRDNEYKFRAWLGVVCSQAVSRHIKKYLGNMLTQFPILEDYSQDKNWILMKTYFRGLPPDNSWELYEHLVTILRSANKKAPANLERDIHIFLLYDWADFKDEMIFKIPLFRNLGNRVIDNVVYRMRKVLRLYFKNF